MLLRHPLLSDSQGNVKIGGGNHEGEMFAEEGERYPDVLFKIDEKRLIGFGDRYERTQQTLKITNSQIEENLILIRIVIVE